jgi:hypothetical protein
MPATISVNKQPVNGRQTVTTSAKRLTQIVQSLGSTTFTKNTVVDAGGWSLTNVQAGNIIQVIQADGDEYRGIVQSKDAGTNTITVQGWKRGGVSGRARAEMKPTDGRAAYVLKVDRCKKANAGHPIAAIATQPNHRLPVEADLQEYIDLANVFVIAGSSQGLSYIAM